MQAFGLFKQVVQLLLPGSKSLRHSLCNVGVGRLGLHRKAVDYMRGPAAHRSNDCRFPGQRRLLLILFLVIRLVVRLVSPNLLSWLLRRLQLSAFLGVGTQ